MTVVDQNSRVPPLDPERREALQRAFENEPAVVLAYLYGSQASKRVLPLSDLDLGVFFSAGLSSEQRYETRRRLFANLVKAAGTNEVDLVELNSAPPLLRQRVVESGTLLLNRDQNERVRFIRRAILDYLDTKPLRKEMSKGLEHRLTEGRFGRR